MESMIVIWIIFHIIGVLGNGHLNKIHEMHTRSLPTANSLHGSHPLSRGHNKHHGEKMSPGTRVGAKLGGNRSHRAMGEGKKHSHGGNRGGVFGPTGKAQDQVLRNNIGAGLGAAAAMNNRDAAAALGAMGQKGGGYGGMPGQGIAGGYADGLGKAMGLADAAGNGDVGAFGELNRMAAGGSGPAAAALSGLKGTGAGGFGGAAGMGAALPSDARGIMEPMARNAIAQQEGLAQALDRPSPGEPGGGPNTAGRAGQAAENAALARGASPGQANLEGQAAEAGMNKASPAEAGARAAGEIAAAGGSPRDQAAAAGAAAGRQAALNGQSPADQMAASGMAAGKAAGIAGGVPDSQADAAGEAAAARGAELGMTPAEQAAAGNLMKDKYMNGPDAGDAAAADAAAAGDAAAANAAAAGASPAEQAAAGDAAAADSFANSPARAAAAAGGPMGAGEGGAGGSGGGPSGVPASAGAAKGAAAGAMGMSPGGSGKVAGDEAAARGASPMGQADAAADAAGRTNAANGGSPAEAATAAGLAAGEAAGRAGASPPEQAAAAGAAAGDQAAKEGMSPPQQAEVAGIAAGSQAKRAGMPVGDQSRAAGAAAEKQGNDAGMSPEASRAMGGEMAERGFDEPRARAAEADRAAADDIQRKIDAADAERANERAKQAKEAEADRIAAENEARAKEAEADRQAAQRAADDAKAADDEAARKAELDNAAETAARKAVTPMTPEGLGIVGTVPDDAKKVDIENGYMKLPLKSYSGERPKTPKEVMAKKAQDKLSENLRNTVTRDKVPSPLNTIDGDDGTFNIPESAKKLNIDQGTVFYPESAKGEMEKDGMNTDHLKHRYNIGERKDLPIGQGYYAADASGKKMDLPSPNLKSPPQILSGNDEAFDTSKADGVQVDKGSVDMIPWSEYSKKMRPEINAVRRVEPRVPVPVEKALRDAENDADVADAVKKEIITNPSGKKYVKLTPPIGVPQKLPLEEAMIVMNGSSPKLKDTGQDGIGKVDYKNKPRKKPKSLNIAEDAGNKPVDPEEDFTNNAIKDAEDNPDTANIISPNNSFNKNASPEKKGMINKAVGRAPNLAGSSSGRKPEQQGEANIPPEADEGLEKGDKLISYIPEIPVRDAIPGVLEDYGKNYADLINMPEPEFISAFKQIPQDTLIILMRYPMDKNKPGYKDDYNKAYNIIKIIFKDRARDVLPIIAGILSIARDRALPVRVIKKPDSKQMVNKKVVTYPRLENNTVKIVDTGKQVTLLKPSVRTMPVLSNVSNTVILKGTTKPESGKNYISSKSQMYSMTHGKPGIQHKTIYSSPNLGQTKLIPLGPNSRPGGTKIFSTNGKQKMWVSGPVSWSRSSSSSRSSSGGGSSKAK